MRQTYKFRKKKNNKKKSIKIKEKKTLFKEIKLMWVV